MFGTGDANAAAGERRPSPAALVALCIVLIAVPLMAAGAYFGIISDGLLVHTSAELQGVDQISLMQSFLHDASGYLMHAQCAPGNGRAAQFRAAAAGDFARLSAFERRRSAYVPPQWARVVRAWQAVNIAGPIPAPAQAAFLRSMGEMFRDVSDATGLTYDPEIVGIDLADALTYRFPDAVERLQNVRRTVCIGTARLPTLLEIEYQRAQGALFLYDGLGDVGDAIAQPRAAIDVRDLAGLHAASMHDDAVASAAVHRFEYAHTNGNRRLAVDLLTAQLINLQRLSTAAVPPMQHILQQRYDGYKRQFAVSVLTGALAIIPAFLAAWLMLGVWRTQHALQAAHERAALHEHEAMHDPLTGLLNRRAFFSAVRESFVTGKAGGVLCVLDVDEFKRVNDTYGHQTGDAVLVHLANVLQKAVRVSDAVARLGGDEFAIFLGGNTNRMVAERVLVEIMHAFSAPLAVRGHMLQCSLTAGASSVGGSSEADIDMAIADADRALYRVKSASRGGFAFSEA